MQQTGIGKQSITIFSLLGWVRESCHRAIPYHHYIDAKIGKTKFVVDEDGEADTGSQETHGGDNRTKGPKLAGSLVEADGYGMRSMFGRMGNRGDTAAEN